LEDLKLGKILIPWNNKLATLPRLKIPNGQICKLLPTMLNNPPLLGSLKRGRINRGKTWNKKRDYMILKINWYFAHEFEKSFKQAIDETLNSLFNW